MHRYRDVVSANVFVCKWIESASHAVVARLPPQLIGRDNTMKRLTPSIDGKKGRSPDY